MITTTVTWADLQNALNSELADLRDAYDDLRATARDEFGDDALDRTLPNDPDQLDDDERDLYVYRRQLAQYDEGAKTIQRRQHALERIRDEYGDGDFEIKMLSGEETLEIEQELRMLAQERDVSVSVVETRRNGLVTDAAVVDAPDDFPTGEDGTPKPSAAPNALTIALWEQANALNNSGDEDFTAAGFGDSPAPASSPGDTSATPTASGGSSTHSDAVATPDADTPPHGDT